MQKMCKNMGERNMTPFMKDMKMPNKEMMEKMCKMMEKSDFASPKHCSEFMEKFMQK